MQAEAEQALLAQQEEALRQEEAERRARQEERRRQAGEVLHAEMEEICRKYQVVGMSLAVFDEEGVFYRQSYGYADVEAGIPAGEDTIYRAASVSKCVTALLALDLASEGKIDPEAPLPRLGRCEVVSRYPDAPITLRHLLTHTAGLADSETYREAVAEKVLPPLGEVLESCYTGAKPGTQYCYTNFGLGLVSGVMEAVTGERFLDYTREQVFEPMGLFLFPAHTPGAGRQYLSERGVHRPHGGVDRHECQIYRAPAGRALCPGAWGSVHYGGGPGPAGGDHGRLSRGGRGSGAQ